MKSWLHKIEKGVDAVIPYALVVLLGIIIGEIFFHDAVYPYIKYIHIADYMIISIFIVDLVFKYMRMKNLPKFLRSSWIELIAIFPAFLVIRVFEIFVSLTRIELLADSIHGTLTTTARYQQIIAELEKEGKVARLIVADRFLQPLARLPRFAKAITFFEHPTKAHWKKA